MNRRTFNHIKRFIAFICVAVLLFNEASISVSATMVEGTDGLAENTANTPEALGEADDSPSENGTSAESSPETTPAATEAVNDAGSQQADASSGENETAQGQTPTASPEAEGEAGKQSSADAPGTEIESEGQKEAEPSETENTNPDNNPSVGTEDAAAGQEGGNSTDLGQITEENENPEASDQQSDEESPEEKSGTEAENSEADLSAAEAAAVEKENAEKESETGNADSVSGESSKTGTSTAANSKAGTTTSSKTGTSTAAGSKTGTTTNSKTGTSTAANSKTGTTTGSKTSPAAAANMQSKTSSSTQKQTPVISNALLGGVTFTRNALSVGTPSTATDDLTAVIEKVKTAADTDEELVVGDEGAPSLSLTCKISGSETLTSGAKVSWTVQDGQASDKAPAAKAGAVTLANADQNTVTITPNAGWQGGVVKITAKVTYPLNGGSNSKEISSNVTVWTNRGIELYVNASLCDDKKAVTPDAKTAEVGAELGAARKSSVGADSSYEEDELDSENYSFQWQKRKDTPNADGSYSYDDIGDAKKSIYIPSTEGVYRAHVTAVKDPVNLRNAYDAYTDGVAVSKVYAKLVWSEAEHVYDGEKEISYTGKYKLVRTENEEKVLVEETEVPSAMTLTLPSADAASYELENVGPNEDLAAALSDQFKITEYGTLPVSVTPKPLTAVVTAADKNFDGNSQVEAVIKAKCDGVLAGTSRADLFVKEAGKEPAAEDTFHKLGAADLSFENEGNVDEDTELAVSGPAEGAVALSGKVSKNYTVTFTYDKATIKKNSFLADTVQLADCVQNGDDGTIWVKSSPVTVNAAAEGYTVCAVVDGSYAASAQAGLSEDGKAEVYVKNAEGDIGKVVLSGIMIDKTAPAIETTEKDNLYFKKVSVTYTISDGESGLDEDSVFYYPSLSEKASLTFDASKWTKGELTESDGKYVLSAEFDKTVGYVYVRALDALGNENMIGTPLLLIEEDKPKNPVISCDDAEIPQKSHSVSINAEDANIENKTKDTVEASGIQKITLSLFDENENDVTKQVSFELNSGEGMDEAEINGYTVTRAEAPGNYEDAVGAASMNISVTVTAAEVMEGSYTLKATATDYCGNISEAGQLTVLLDNMAPRVTVTMEGGNSVDNVWYYKADNCGVKVAFEDAFLEKGGTYKAAIRKKGGSGEFETLSNISGSSASIDFSNETVAQLEDGCYEVIFEAVDGAGNSASEYSEESKGTVISTSGVYNAAVFTLDTTAPLVTGIETWVTLPEDGEADVKDSAKTGKVKDNTAYYNRPFTIRVKVEDENMAVEDCIYTIAEGKAPEQEKAGAEGSRAAIGEDGWISFDVETEKDPRQFAVLGRDYAGNAIVLSEELTQESSESKEDQGYLKNSGSGVNKQAKWENCTYTLQEGEEGASLSLTGVRTTYLQVYDARLPKVSVSYKRASSETLEESYIYDKYAYYNSDISANFTFMDLDEADREGLSIQVIKDQDKENAKTYAYKDLEKEEVEGGEVFYSLLLGEWLEEKERDGEYRISVSGKNLSETLFSVTEMEPADPEKEAYKDCVKRVENNGNETLEGVTLSYTLVRDTNAPQLTGFTVIPDETVANKELNKDFNKRFYFNGKFTVKAQIEDANLPEEAALSTIVLRRAEETSDVNGSQFTFKEMDAFKSVSFDAENAETAAGYSFANGQAVFSQSVDADGVYAYALYGSDLAGNTLTYPQDVEGSSLMTVSAGTDEASEIKAFISPYIVKDTVIPKGLLTIKALIQASDNEGGFIETSELAYSQETDAAYPSYYMPYQSTNKAEIVLAAGSEEKSPLKISYDVLEKNGTEKTSHVTMNDTGAATFLNDASLSYTIENRRIICVVEGLLEDLAGNRSSAVNSCNIYLDTNAPNCPDEPDGSPDVIAPVVMVEPIISDGYYGNEGERLFSGDVKFKVTVTEPYSEAVGTPEANRSSSGIAKVTWKVTNLKLEEVLGENEGTLFEQGKTVQIGEQKFADESSLIFQYKSNETNPVVVKADAATNRNDLCLVVAAEDNAGNESSFTYNFGIDITEPTLAVAFDNNTAKNGKYFDAGRTATITVTERNFNKDTAIVEVAADTWTDEMELYSDSGWSKRNVSADVANGNGDTYVRTIKFQKDGDFTLKIRGFTDDAGNESKEITIPADTKAFASEEDKRSAYGEFTIDTEAPRVSICMDNPEKSYSEKNPKSDDTKYYYRADNCGFTVTIDDNEHKLITPDGSGAEYGCKVTNGGDTRNYNASNLPETETDKEITFVFPSEAVAKYGDGGHEIIVKAVDAAGNEAVTLLDSSVGCLFAKEKKDGREIIKGTKGSFVLDTTAPELVSIETNDASVHKAAETGKITSNILYEDLNSVYYNAKIEVVTKVEDCYISADDFTGLSETVNNKTGAKSQTAGEFSIEEVSAKEKEGASFAAGGTMNAEMTTVFAMAPGSHYDGVVLSGEDKAGNKLVLKEEYAKANDNDKMTDGGMGELTALHGKTVDNENPKVLISYHSEDKANLYKGEESFNGKFETAYYNKNIRVDMAFSDNYELDGSLLTAGQDNAAASSAAKVRSLSAYGMKGTQFSYSIPTILVAAEGRYTYAAAGTDRALNPIVVREMKPQTDSNPNDSYEKEVKGKSFKSKYELVLDKTAPVFTFSVSSPGAANKELNSQGNRYYFNSAFTAAAKITDTNFDPAKIVMKRGAVTEGNYDSSTALVSAYDVKTIANEKDSKGAATLRYTDTVSADGVYRYAVYGSDKAGNALVSSKAAYNLDGTDSKTVNLKEETGRGSLETLADTTNHIVIDTVKPAGTISILNAANSEYYRMLTNGNVEIAEPYRDERSARIRLTVDSKVERTPVKIDYAVTAQPDSSSQSGTFGKYIYNHAETVAISGRQQFKASEYTLTDLAGNSVTAASKNFIYLDQDDLPNQDRLAPVTTIAATAPASVRGGKGQDLFRGDVSLNVKVTDPYGQQSSSGLADIHYDVYVNGAKVDADTRTLHSANREFERVNYSDPKLDYVLDQTITIPAASHNYNDLKVVVTAFDNAGNSSTAQYEFGIDITAPKIRVVYDNNSVQNGKYFKEDRVATVTVTERNFNEPAMRIATESAAAISGWSHVSGPSANGDDDTWSCTVAYRTDGNYTLSVAGADLLSWTASDIQYVGEVPQDFVLDKTAPVLSVSYDNNDSANGKYYKADRTATLSVSDVNFQGTNDIAVSAEGGGSAPGVAFGGDSASMPFTEDGIYSFTGTVTDQAGNVSNVIAEEEFVIDKTLPEIEVSGVEDLSANRDPLSIVVSMTDTNLNADSISVKLNGTMHGEVGVSGSRNAEGTNAVYNLDQIDIDDYYTLYYTATDLAGNEVTKTISFSENQKGTGFEFIGEIQDNGYALVRFTPEYRLTNVDEITILSAAINGQEVPYTLTSSGEVLKSTLRFDQELPSDGKYVINLEVSDAAGNISTDRQEFIVDTMAPKLTILGLSDDVQRYYEEFVITLRKESESDEFLLIQLDGKELVEGSGEGTYTVAENGDVYVTISEFSAHELLVLVRDEAGNMTVYPEQDETKNFVEKLSELVRKGVSVKEAASETETFEPRRFELTNNLFLKLWDNKPAFFLVLTLATVLAALLFLFIWRRRERRKENM
ncbi:MAG: hypothetical protein K6E30_05900 [Lachnospiraceae bacterium]|nr:hypothetical protein [Lachnospiraceae bacterium]